MEIVLVLVGAIVGGAVAWNVAKKHHGGGWRERADGVVYLQQCVNARLPADTAHAVYGVTLSTCRGEFRDYVEARLQEQPTPPVDV